MIFKTLRIVSLFIVAAFLGGSLLQVSQKVQDTQDHLFTAQANVDKERETIHALEVEWSTLTRPARLEILAKEHLAMDLPPSEKEATP